ncbi:MAG: Crp/Fnr family transcriptional regulator [Deltaproteobacteria bacterium]|nr:Crp/Fnr family transcriptional regulator [Deltaproteobacteria bacterium]
MMAIEILSRVPIFSGLDPGELKKIDRLALHRSYRRGQTLFSEGDGANGFFIVLSGRVKVFKISPNGKEQILHVFGPGEPFGEAALFAERTFPASAVAQSACRVFFFPRSDFLDLIRNEPALALAMMGVMARRLMLLTNLVEGLSLKDVPSRVASYFLAMGNASGSDSRLNLDIAKGELASLLGTAPETLSRILARMIGESLIAVEGSCITILDRHGLEAVAGGERKLS